MKYIIEVDDESTDGLYKVKGFETLVFNEAELKKLEPVSGVIQHGYDDGYQDGLDDAWESAKKIYASPRDGGYTLEQLTRVFGESSMSAIARTHTASDAIAKIKAYEEEKKADAELKVGDEVIVPNGKCCVVTGFNGGDNKWILCIDENGDCGPNYHEKTDLKKTGRHFPQIEEVLKQMRGE